MARLRVLMNGDRTLWRIVDVETQHEVSARKVSVTCPVELVLGRPTGGWLEADGDIELHGDDAVINPSTQGIPKLAGPAGGRNAQT